jgi:hypothetical protein
MYRIPSMSLPCHRLQDGACSDWTVCLAWLQGGIFAPVIPGDLEELKLKELKNGRLAM